LTFDVSKGICNKNNEYDCYTGLFASWYAFAMVVLVQPSSTAAERDFSLLKHVWSDQQTLTLSDMITLSLCSLNYNKQGTWWMERHRNIDVNAYFNCHFLSTFSLFAPLHLHCGKTFGVDTVQQRTKQVLSFGGTQSGKPLNNTHTRPLVV
jgi:hypothetical protein